MRRFRRTDTPASANPNPPLLLITDSDNLTVHDQLQLPENLAGKSVLTSDHNTMYSISDSGVLVLPVGNLSAYPRLAASVEDLVFRGNFCNRNVNTQTLTITDPGGKHTPFTISTTTSGSHDFAVERRHAGHHHRLGGSQCLRQRRRARSPRHLTISSASAVNLPQTVRVLINSQDPSQRGSFIDIPGKVVDVLADPKRNVYYVLRQDKNQVLVFNAANNTQTATLRTCTTPTSMAITFDQQDLLVGCDNSHYMSVYDLDLLAGAALYRLAIQDYVESVAVSSNAILAMIRPGGGRQRWNRPDQHGHSRTGTSLPTLGVYQNKLARIRCSPSSSNGSQILIAGSDGSVMLYDANAGTFTVSRKDFSSLGGALCSFELQSISGREQSARFLAACRRRRCRFRQATPSGFAFVNQTGYFVTAPNAATPGIIARSSLNNGTAFSRPRWWKRRFWAPSHRPTPTSAPRAHRVRFW